MTKIPWSDTANQAIEQMIKAAQNNGCDYIFWEELPDFIRSSSRDREIRNRIRPLELRYKSRVYPEPWTDEETQMLIDQITKRNRICIRDLPQSLLERRSQMAIHQKAHDVKKMIGKTKKEKPKTNKKNGNGIIGEVDSSDISAIFSHAVNEVVKRKLDAHVQDKVNELQAEIDKLMSENKRLMTLLQGLKGVREAVEQWQVENKISGRQ